jgi:hypothetical protein
MKRQEKRQMKAEKRAQRKLSKTGSESVPEIQLVQRQQIPEAKVN